MRWRLMTCIAWAIATVSYSGEIGFEAQWEAYPANIGDEGSAVLGSKITWAGSGQISQHGRWGMDIEARVYSSGMQNGIEELIGPRDPAHHPYVLLPDFSAEWQLQNGAGLRAGSWIEHAGNSSMFNPIDIRIWPYGYRTFIDQDREAVTAGQLFWRSDVWEIKLTGVPWQSPSRLPLSDSRWAVPLFDPENADDPDDSGTVAASIHYKGGFFDGEILAFRGQDPLPYVRLGEDGAVTSPDYALGEGIAAQAELFLSSWILRAETVAAWYGQEVDSLLQYVLGIEYRYPLGFSAWELSCSLEYAGEDIFKEGHYDGFPRPFSNALLAKCRMAKGLDFGLDVTYVEDLDFDGRLCSISMDGNVSENCTARIKLEVLQGDGASFFGYFTQNDRLLLETAWKF